MKKNTIAKLFLVLFCILSFAGAVTADSATASDAAGLIISDLKVYPGTLMPGEEGTAYVTVKNTGVYSVFTEGITVYSAKGVKVTTYDQSVGNLNPGDSITIAFALKAGSECGTFYPYVTINYYYNPGNGNIHNFAKLPVSVIVDNKAVSISVLNRPDVFQPETTQTLSLIVGNLRSNDIEGVEISVSGTGVTSREGKVFIGSIPANSSGEAAITVLTTEETNEVILTVNYRNGANWHSESIKLPLSAGTSKTSADLVINNIEIKQEINYTSVTGDVNNAGLTTAKAVVISTKDTTEAGPYPEYVVGSLDTDGLSEFTVTFRTDNPKVLLYITYKDIIGNEYIQTKEVTLSTLSDNPSVSVNMNSGSILPTVLIILAALAVLAVGIIAWRKGLFRKNQ